MKEIHNITLYSCDFCGKKYRRKHDCLRHETKCSKNPKNKHKCFYCVSLEKRECSEPCYDYSKYYFNYHSFFCTKKDVELYSYKLTDRLKPFIGGELMPNECDLFEDKNFERK